MSEMSPYNQLGWSDLKLPLGQCPGCSEKCSTIGMLGRRTRWQDPAESYNPAQCEVDGTASFVPSNDPWYSVLRSLLPVPDFQLAYSYWVAKCKESNSDPNTHRFVQWLAAYIYIELVDES